MTIPMENMSVDGGSKSRSDRVAETVITIDYLAARSNPNPVEM